MLLIKNSLDQNKFGQKFVKFALKGCEVWEIKLKLTLKRS